MSSAHDHEQGRGRVGCGLLGILLLSGLFLSGSWNVPAIVNDSRKWDKKQLLGSIVEQEGSLTFEDRLQ